MEKEFVPYKEAKTLKGLGFDEKCMAVHLCQLNNSHKITFGPNENKDDWGDSRHCSAPLYQQAFRWFRDKPKLYTRVTPHHGQTTRFYYEIIDEGPERSDAGLHSLYQTNEMDWETYEEAELACLKKLIETVKEKL